MFDAAASGATVAKTTTGPKSTLRSEANKSRITS